MTKKRHLGLSLVSLVLIIFFGYSCYFFLYFFPLKDRPWYIVFRFSACLALSLLGLIASIFVPNIKRWARKMVLYATSFFLALGIVGDIQNYFLVKLFSKSKMVTFADLVSTNSVILYVFWIALIFFFTRPEIKKLFKQ